MILYDPEYYHCYKLWSPYVPLLLLCDNQATVHVFNKAFSLDRFGDKTIGKKNSPFTFEELTNVLFRDVLGISAESHVGRDFLKEFMPRKQKDFKSLEVSILPCYVHTTQCTADHLTRGESQLLNGYRVKIDPKKCLQTFGMFEVNFRKAQVPKEMLFRTLKQLSNLIKQQQEQLTDYSCTSWESQKRRW